MKKFLFLITAMLLIYASQASVSLETDYVQIADSIDRFEKKSGEKSKRRRKKKPGSRHTSARSGKNR